MRPIVLFALVLIALTAAAVAWLPPLAANHEQIARSRDEYALRANTIEIAVVWPEGDDRLWDGASFAVSEINRTGGVGGRPIRLSRYSAEGIGEASVARRIARNPRFVAVVGHTNSLAAKQAAVSYDTHQLLFMAVTATDPSITRESHARTVFRTVPTDEAMASLLAQAVAPGGALSLAGGSAAAASGRVGVLYTRTPHFILTPFVDVLEGQLSDAGATLAFEKAYDGSLVSPRVRGIEAGIVGTRFQPNLEAARLRSADELRSALFAGAERGAPLDAIVLLDDSHANAERAISHIRWILPSTPVITSIGAERGASSPCVAEYDLEDGRWQRALTPPAEQPATGAIYVATPFCHDRPDVQALVRAFESRRYPGSPRLDFVSAQGYEAIQFLRQAMERARSSAPLDVAAALRTFELDSIHSGKKVSFRANGDIAGKQIFIVRTSRRRG